MIDINTPPPFSVILVRWMMIHETNELLLKALGKEINNTDPITITKLAAVYGTAGF